MKVHKNMNNIELANLLRAMSAAYKIKGDGKNKFKIVAYERAADAIEHLSSEAKDIWDEGKLEDISGVGKSIAEHLDEIFKTGKSTHYQKLTKDLPPAVFELIKVPGIGPKNAFKLAEELKITSSKNAIQKLKKAAEKGKIETLEHFGKDSQESILTSIQEHQNKPEKRMLINKAEGIAGQILAWMEKDENTKRADALGSLRRKASTVGDIDIAASTQNPQKTLNHFTKYPNKTRVLEKGDRTASIIIPGNIQIDLMVEKPESYGALLQHFTGSKHHNIAVRELALKKGYSVSDYGIKKAGKLIKLDSEEKLYEKLGLSYIPPELRQDTGEIEAAKSNKLPSLVKLNQLKGDLHMHSDFNIETSHDVGTSSIKELVKKASSLNYEYIALTEHNPSQKNHKDKDFVKLLKRKREKIDKINYSLKKQKNKGVKKVFNSLEIDILPNGQLPVPDEAMQFLDFALVSIHSSFSQSKKKMTRRVLKALAHPKVKIFAHPTGRVLNKRESVELDWKKIFEFCLNNKKWLEINADPARLDLPDHIALEAVKKGVTLTISTDAHDSGGLDNMRFGVYVAQRAWAEKKNIANTRSLSKFEKML